MKRTRRVENARAIDVRDDRVLLATRWVSAILVPFLLAAFAILYQFPDHTQVLFAWGIQPRMSAMMLGAAYLGGAHFFVRVAALAPWHCALPGATDCHPLLVLEADAADGPGGRGLAHGGRC
jgi:hypothetical protein